MEPYIFFFGVFFIASIVVYVLKLVFKTKPQNKNAGVISNLPRREIK